MNSDISFMRREIEEIPRALGRLYEQSCSDIKDTAIELRKLDPSLIISVGRGSSDHAASYLKYAIELIAKIPVSSLGPSIASIYNCKLNLGKTASLIISQSGQSPDIIKTADMLKSAGSLNIAFTNVQRSSIFDVCDHTIELRAGVEKSVAATKTYVSSIVAGLWLIGYWKDDKKLLNALEKLPYHLEKAILCDWVHLESALASHGLESILVLGRGLSYGVAKEAALKLKEVCQFHAESFSSAEVLHGPVSMVDKKTLVMVFSLQDETRNFIEMVAKGISGITSSVFISSDSPDLGGMTELSFIKTDHFLTDPISLITSFYAMVEGLAQKLNLDPDKPRNLRKVTETL